ncbi:MAG TPA: diheme cytochrome c-553 [Puia sp.]|jgi:cytochrome c553|nr:diheme cytochrome c-553 [Puia sp.]
MKKASLLSAVIAALIIFFSFSQFSCTQTAEAKTDSAAIPKQMSQAEMISRGKYIVMGTGCNDCHSPKVMTAMGPVPDSTKLLSGHPASQPLLPIDKKVLQPGNWILFGPDLTMTVGPWGISYSANLTPDSATGLGAWTDDVFIKTLRTGKHLGQDGGRQILPPMPWEAFGKYTDEDLRSIFAYLKALPPISNKVPAPVSPPDVAKMK